MVVTTAGARPLVPLEHRRRSSMFVPEALIEALAKLRLVKERFADNMAFFISNFEGDDIIRRRPLAVVVSPRATDAARFKAFESFGGFRSKSEDSSSNILRAQHSEVTVIGSHRCHRFLEDIIFRPPPVPSLRELEPRDLALLRDI